MMFLHRESIPWVELTISPKKEKLFSSDFYFELSYEAALQTIKSDIGLKLRNYTLLFIKPEALISNKTDILIEELKKHHFELVYISIKPISHTQISELWKYMWSSASLIRIIINHAYYTQYDCGVLILRNRHHTSRDSCAFLSEIKGSTSKGPYKEPDIRYHMNAINTFLNHIHSPDEIVDFMREMAVFFNWDELKEIYYCILTNKTISFDILKDKSPLNACFSTVIPPAEILVTLIQKIQEEIQTSTQMSRTLKLTNIYKELLLIKSKKTKLSHTLLEKMRDSSVLVWDWPMFIFVTTYMEYFNDYQSLI